MTGLIFMKYSLDITPRNWNLFSVNAFLAATAAYQLARKLNKDYIEVRLRPLLPCGTRVLSGTVFK